MGPLTKRRHSTHRSGRRQAGQKAISTVAKNAIGYVTKRARRALARTAKS
ncbi:MAG TPA: hypothetical protein VLH19_04350 [Patescibacteria group bacterium]|nr:hypothetical protein [Patescibacteria group bacterium]